MLKLLCKLNVLCELYVELTFEKIYLCVCQILRLWSTPVYVQRDFFRNIAFSHENFVTHPCEKLTCATHSHSHVQHVTRLCEWLIHVSDLFMCVTRPHVWHTCATCDSFMWSGGFKRAICDQSKCVALVHNMRLIHISDPFMSVTHPCQWPIHVSDPSMSVTHPCQCHVSAMSSISVSDSSII